MLTVTTTYHDIDGDVVLDYATTTDMGVEYASAERKREVAESYAATMRVQYPGAEVVVS